MSLDSPPRSVRRQVDPVTASIIRARSGRPAADQMLVTLRRTAFSPIIYDMLDGAGAFYDRQFRMLSQIQCLPLPPAALASASRPLPNSTLSATASSRATSSWSMTPT